MPAATEYGDYAQWEFERRYLLRALPPELDRDGPRTRLTDLYIDSTRFRVREHRNLHNDFCVMKLGQKFTAREGEYGRIIITNSYLTRAEYDLFNQLPGRRIVKMAWPYPHDGRRYGIDAFEGALSGLILAEIEFTSEQQMRDVPPPPFACVEVTNRIEFTGGYLAGRSFADLRPLVDELTTSIG